MIGFCADFNMDVRVDFSVFWITLSGSVKNETLAA